MGYYEVVAKCGHVGREYYYEGHFFLSSSCASSAAQYVKTLPRVKKDHGDAILWVNEVDKDEYVAGCKAMSVNPYFACTSKHEQNAVWDLIKEGIKPETERQVRYRDSKRRRNYTQRRERNSKGIRNPYKYAKYNSYSKDEYSDVWSAGEYYWTEKDFKCTTNKHEEQMPFDEKSVAHNDETMYDIDIVRKDD